MIAINVTKKLLAKLPVKETGQFESDPDHSQWLAQRPLITDNPLSGWHANLLLFQRRQHVLMVHDKTRFPVFIPCLVKQSFANFERCFVDSLMNTLLKSGASESQMETANQLLAPLKIQSHCDRSVLGTLNQMGQELEHSFWYDHVNVSEVTGYRQGAWLADRPCTVKGQFTYPLKEMLDMLEALS